MASSSPMQEDSAEQKADLDRFIQELVQYHARRGTHFDISPRVGSRTVNVLRLFQHVVSNGGYDVVSAEKLGWRRIGDELGFATNTVPSLSFSLKSVYYKYLAAYEISKIHHKEPPPREILEDLTARGGDLLNRTLENYRPRGGRELANSTTADEVEAVSTTEPSDEVVDHSSGGRTARGLRQAPPPRVLFQPDISSARHARPTNSTASAPQPSGASHSTGVAQASMAQASMTPELPSTLATFEPEPPITMPLRPVPTSSNDPAMTDQRRNADRLRNRLLGRSNAPVTQHNVILPGTGYEGPNIYVRTVLSLRSEIPIEQSWALQHLVKISYERGDKFRFEAFPGLVEGLLEKILEVGSLIFDEDWTTILDDEDSLVTFAHRCRRSGPDDAPVPDALFRALELQGNLQTADSVEKLRQICEASLVLRNMVMLDENAKYFADRLASGTFLCMLLNLPSLSALEEVRQNALEVTESASTHLDLTADHPLHLTLHALVLTSDRAKIVCGLRTITRLSTSLEDGGNGMKDIPANLTELARRSTETEDDDLIQASLDFLYSYTVHSENVQKMVDETNPLDLSSLIARLIALLLHGAKVIEHMTPPVSGPPKVSAPSLDQNAGLQLPVQELQRLTQMLEPERSGHWLRICFEEEPDSDVTQIQIWHAYQDQMSVLNPAGEPILAADFIKNISTIFTNARAQVLSGPDGDEATQRYIIRGIHWRKRPINEEGKPYVRCLWRTTTPGEPCGQFVLGGGEAIWEHVLISHLGVVQQPDGKRSVGDISMAPYFCAWDDCSKFQPDGEPVFNVLLRHLKLHLHPLDKTTKPKAPLEIHGGTRQIYYDTPTDERGRPTGIAMAAVLVLRNLARQLSRLPIPEGQHQKWSTRLFTAAKRPLAHVVAYNRTLTVPVSDVMAIVVADCRPGA